MPNIDPNSQPRPLWADELLRLWQQPPQPTLAQVVEQLARPGALPDGVEPPSYNVARRYLLAMAAPISDSSI